MLTEHLLVKVVSHFFSLMDNQFAPKKWQFPMTKYINLCMHVALTYLWTCIFFEVGGGGGQMGLEAVVVAWHIKKAELINFSYQFDFLTSFTNLLHLSLNISCIIILFWESGIERWVWPDIRAEVIAFSFYFLTSWTNIVWKWIWNNEKQARDYQIGLIHLQHMPIAVTFTGQMCWLFKYVIVNPP